MPFSHLSRNDCLVRRRLQGCQDLYRTTPVHLRRLGLGYTNPSLEKHMNALDHLSLTAPSNVGAFLVRVQQTAIRHGVSLVISDQPYVPYPGSSMDVSGYFIDRPRRELAVGTGKPVEEWLPTFVHESCHMDQWAEDAPVWNRVMVEGREAVDWLDEWVNGREDLPCSLQELADRVRAVELDCERRVVSRILEYGLPIDVSEYAQKGNAYCYYYDHLILRRGWYEPGQAPYERADVWSVAPTTIDPQAAMPEGLSQAFHRAYPIER